MESTIQGIGSDERSVDDIILELGLKLTSNYELLLKDLRENKFEGAAERYHEMDKDFEILNSYTNNQNSERIIIELNKNKEIIETILNKGPTQPPVQPPAAPSNPAATAAQAATAAPAAANAANAATAAPCSTSCCLLILQFKLIYLEV